MKYWLLLIYSIQVLPCIAATPIKLGIFPDTLTVNQAELTLIKRAFKHAKIPLELVNLPAERSLQTAAAGIIDGDAIRQPSAVAEFTSLLPVKVPLKRSDIWVWVKSDKKCPANTEELWQMKPVGILGVRYYNLIYAQSKVGYIQGSNAKIAARILLRERADYIAATASSIKKIALNQALTLRSCLDKPIVSFQQFTYLHIKHAHLIPVLETSYRYVISQQNGKILSE